MERFLLLYHRSFLRLVRDLRRRLPAGTAAEDIAQETLVRAFVKLGQYDSDRPMWPWIRAISRRVLADHCRKPRPDLPVDAPDRALPQPEMATIEDRALLSEALGRLSPRHRQAVGLRYVEDREPRKAAAALGLSVTAFNQLLFRARKRLREEYERLTEGLPAALGLRWLREQWRTASRGARRRGTELSQASWAEPLAKAAAVGAVLVLALLPPIDHPKAPAEASPRAPGEAPRSPGPPIEVVEIAGSSETGQAPWRPRPAEPTRGAGEDAAGGPHPGPPRSGVVPPEHPDPDHGPERTGASSTDVVQTGPIRHVDDTVEVAPAKDPEDTLAVEMPDQDIIEVHAELPQPVKSPTMPSPTDALTEAVSPAPG